MERSTRLIGFLTQDLGVEVEMELLTPQLCAQIPLLYTQEHIIDPTAYVRLFHPLSDWSWYVLEFDGEDECFSLTRGCCAELGYFFLSELASLRVHGLGVRRDRSFQPCLLSQIRQGL